VVDDAPVDLGEQGVVAAPADPLAGVDAGPALAHEDGAGPQQYYELAAKYGITIQDDWIEDLERTYGVKL